MANRKLFVDVELKGLKKAKVSLKGIEKQGLSSIKVISTGFIAAAAAVALLVVGFRSLVRGIKSSIEAFNEQAQAEARLVAGLTNVGDASEIATEKLLNQAKALQSLTGMSDGLIVSAQGMLSTFMLTSNEISVLTPRLLDMAAGTAKIGEGFGDVESIALAMGKALAQGAGALSRYGVVLTDVQRESFNAAEGLDKVNILAEILDANFKGMAVAMGDTYAGAVNKMGEAWGDAQEAMGAWIAESPGVKAILDTITGKIGDLTGAINDSNASSEDLVGHGFAAIVKGGIVIVKSVASITQGFMTLTWAIKSAHLAIIDFINILTEAGTKGIYKIVDAVLGKDAAAKAGVGMVLLQQLTGMGVTPTTDLRNAVSLLEEKLWDAGVSIDYLDDLLDEIDAALLNSAGTVVDVYTPAITTVTTEIEDLTTALGDDDGLKEALADVNEELSRFAKIAAGTGDVSFKVSSAMATAFAGTSRSGAPLPTMSTPRPGRDPFVRELAENKKQCTAAGGTWNETTQSCDLPKGQPWLQGAEAQAFAQAGTSAYKGNYGGAAGGLASFYLTPALGPFAGLAGMIVGDIVGGLFEKKQKPQAMKPFPVEVKNWEPIIDLLNATKELLVRGSGAGITNLNEMRLKQAGVNI